MDIFQVVVVLFILLILFIFVIVINLILSVMINNIYIENFRCYKKTDINIKQLSIIVGRNNAGKSTLIEALRIVSVVTNRFRNLQYKRAPNWVNDKNEDLYGVFPSIDNLDISTQNIFHMYSSSPAIIEVSFINKTLVRVYIGDNAAVFAVIFDNNHRVVSNKRMANNVDIAEINILPQISTLLLDEKIIQYKTVQSNILTKLSSRNFRNQLKYYYDDFIKFKDLAESSWKGLGIISLDNKDGFTGEIISLMVRDNSFLAEIGWMGHGMQMWLQTMWFLARASENSTVILDEPDVYMHADLQRKLIRIIKERYKQIIIATHSVEIMSEVEPDNILPIDCTKEKQSYANKPPMVQAIIENIGSVHNLEIARLFSSKKFLIFEGESDDVKILGIFQSIVYPKTEEQFDVIPKTHVDGWSGWQRVIGAFNVLKKTDINIQVYCIFDSDYHTEDEKNKRLNEAKKLNINLHIWDKKEIENYLLNDGVIARYINKNQNKGKELTVDIISDKLKEIADSMKEEFHGNYATAIHNTNKSKEVSTCMAEAKLLMNEKWGDYSLDLICGKVAISKLSSWSKSEYGVSINKFALAREFSIQEISNEVKDIIEKIEHRKAF